MWAGVHQDLVTAYVESQGPFNSNRSVERLCKIDGVGILWEQTVSYGWAVRNFSHCVVAS